VIKWFIFTSSVYICVVFKTCDLSHKIYITVYKSNTSFINTCINFNVSNVLVRVLTAEK